MPKGDSGQSKNGGDGIARSRAYAAARHAGGCAQKSFCDTSSLTGDGNGLNIGHGGRLPERDWAFAPLSLRLPRRAGRRNAQSVDL